MKYLALPRPHPNSRYQAEALRLMESEIMALCEKCGTSSSVEIQSRAGVDWLSLECETLTAAQLECLSHSAHLYVLFEQCGTSLNPIVSRRCAYLGEDLPAVLKYKGKTNEVFTAYMLNLALCASDFGFDDAVTVLDPMCGRGTTLFEAANNGWSCVGLDADQAAVDEAGRYFKKYLEYHGFKHEQKRVSRTMAQKRSCQMNEFTYAADAASFRDGSGRRTLSLAKLEAQDVSQVYRQPLFHLIAADLPYGVQHAPSMNKKRGTAIEDLLYEALPSWTECLRTGGAVCLSFNENTIKPEIVRGMMSEAGLDVMYGPAYSDLRHWVEQAITRDVAVAVRRF